MESDHEPEPARTSYYDFSRFDPLDFQPGLIMSVNVVLRFRDFEAETVQKHRSVINEMGAVWWAWWKKESEEYQAEALAALSAACPVNIGLINRQRDTRFLARCTRVVYSPDGSPLTSPEADWTPRYYRKASFPAWFLLTEIRKLSVTDWDEIFGGVPLGEPTFFALPAQQPGRAEQLQEEQFAVQPVSTRSSVILHLSDLHFGSDYGFPVSGRKVPTLQQTLDEAIAQGLEHVGISEVGIVVVSGDITTAGEQDGFVEARTFLERLLDRLNLEPQHLVVVPGNHDILLDDSHVTRSYAAEQPFRDMLNLLLRSGNTELNRIHWFSSEDGNEILVLALNSVRPRAKSTMEYGYVGRDLYFPLVKELQQLRSEIVKQGAITPLLAAVLHHHVLPTPLVEEPSDKRPVSLTLDAGQLIEDLQRVGFHAILHGHQHVPFVGNTSRAFRNKDGSWELRSPIHVIGGGSCGVRSGRLWNQMRNNSVGIYRPMAGLLEVNMYQFAPGVDFSPHLTLQLPIE